jgi:hypothetical protein
MIFMIMISHYLIISKKQHYEKKKTLKTYL